MACREEFECKLSALPKNAAVRLWAILDYIREAVDDSIDAAGVDSLVDYAHGLYDKHIAPIDIKLLDEDDEVRLIDEPAKVIIKQAILGAHALIHTEG